MERYILHVDVNNAFLSWTAVDMLSKGEKIDIRQIPSIIGGDEERRSGIVLAKSPIAKKFGIITGEPIYFAKKKCASLEVLPGNFKVYNYYSDCLYKLLLTYTDKIERFSIDECFMDMTEYLMGRDIKDIAIEINKKVKEQFGFTVNIGIANNKLLAKMASDFEKPDKIHTLFKDEIETKMWPLPVSELFMLGKKTVPKLLNLRIKTIGDLAKTDLTFLVKKFGKHGKMMWDYANGIDNEEVCTKRELPKSIGNSVTLPKDFNNIDDIYNVIVALTDQVTFRLRKHDLVASSISVQLRTKDFEDFSHQKKLSYSTSSTKDILKVSKEILNEMYNGKYIRLIGLSVSGLKPKDEEQLSIFDLSDNKQDKLDKTLDELKNKFGYSLISRASKLSVDEYVKGKENKIKD